MRYPERSSKSPYDVSIACAEVDQINGLMTDRQALELLVHLRDKTDPETDIRVLLSILIKKMRAAIKAAS